MFRAYYFTSISRYFSLAILQPFYSFAFRIAILKETYMPQNPQTKPTIFSPAILHQPQFFL